MLDPLVLRAPRAHQEAILARLRLLSFFRPTTTYPYPSARSGHPIDDALAVLCGTKPAAVIPPIRTHFEAACLLCIEAQLSWELFQGPTCALLAIAPHSSIRALIQAVKTGQPHWQILGHPRRRKTA